MQSSKMLLPRAIEGLHFSSIYTHFHLFKDEKYAMDGNGWKWTKNIPVNRHACRSSFWYIFGASWRIMHKIEQETSPRTARYRTCIIRVVDVAAYTDKVITRGQQYIYVSGASYRLVAKTM